MTDVQEIRDSQNPSQCQCKWNRTQIYKINPKMNKMISTTTARKKRKKEWKKDEVDENQDKFRIQWKIAQLKIPAKRNIAFIFSWNLHESKTMSIYVTCSWPSDAIACRMRRRDANNTKIYTQKKYKSTLY